MITGADVTAGYGYKKEKPYNSILPYLRAKKEEEDKKEEAKKKASEKPENEPETKEETYAEAIHSIVAGE